VNDLDDVLRILVAAAFVAAAVAKLVLSEDRLRRLGMTVVADLSPAARRGIAGLELLGALGLLSPWLFGLPGWSARIAAAGLTLLMAGASWLQVTRRRSAGAAISLVLLTLVASLAVTPTVPVGLP
jgi:hypothetical protein